MTPDQHLADGRLRYRYPSLVAVPYRQSRIARTAALRLGHLLGTVDETVRLLCWIVMAERLADDGAFVADVGGALESPTTASLLKLLRRQVVAGPPKDAFLPELWGLLHGDFTPALTALVEDAAAVRIDRGAVSQDEAEAWNLALEPRVDALLARADVLADILLVRAERVSEADEHTLFLHAWRGVGNARPLLVRAEAPIDPEAVLLLRPGRADALRLDPLLSHATGGRLLSALASPEPGRLIYEVYAGAETVRRKQDLAALLTQRTGRAALPLDEASRRRVDAEIQPELAHLPGYTHVIPTSTDDRGRHFRAVDEASGEVHSVVRIHERLVRDERHLRTLTATAAAVEAIDHPNVDRPAVQRFDPASGSWVVGTRYAPGGRLSDRLPPGIHLPIGWSVDAAIQVLGGLVALARRGIFLADLPGWAISLGDTIQVAPFAAGTGGRPSDGPALVAALLYRMLTGEEPVGQRPLRPSILRRGVHEALDRVVLDGLSGAITTAEDLLAALDEARRQLTPDPDEALASMALQRTFAHLQRLRPGALEGLTASVQSHTLSGEWPGAVAGLAPVVSALWDPAERLARVREVTAILDDGGRQGEPMQQVYRLLVELAGDHLPTLLFVASVAGDALTSRDQLRLRQRILHAAHGDDATARALTDLAQLSERRRELGEARAYWQQLVRRHPDRTDGWQGLARVCRLTDDAEGLAEALEALLERGDQAERLDLLRELARHRLVALGDPGGAAPLLRQAAQLSGGNRADLIALRDVARELADDALLAEALDGLLASDLPAAERDATLLERALMLGMRAHRHDDAIEILDELATRAPSRATLSYRAHLHERAGHWLEAAAALETWAGAEGEPWCFGLALKRLARVQHEVLDDVDRAVELYEGVLETEPTDPEALAFLTRTYAARGDHAALAAILTTRSEVAGTRDERLDLLTRLATLQEEHLADVAAAFDTWEQVLSEDPARAGALERYAALAEANRAGERARPVIEAALAHVDPEAAQSWRRRLGQDAQDVAAAVDAWRARVVQDPRDVAALDGLLGATARIGAWEEHAATLERLVELEPDERQMARLRALAETLRDRVLAPRRAASVLDRMLALDPDHPWALSALCALGEAAGRSPSARVEVVRHWIELCPEPDERLRLLEQVVSLADAAGLDEAERVAALESMIELDPAHPRALAELERRYRKSRDWDRAAALVRQRADTAAPGERPRHLERLCRLHLEAGQPEQAATVLGELQAAFPAHPVDLDLVQDVFVGAGDHQALVQLLARRADASLREDERAELLFRQGAILADHLGNQEEAVACMERALANDRHHLGALGFLSDVYFRDQQWAEARPVAEALVEAIERREEGVNPALEVEAWTRLGEVREQLRELDRAAGAFERVLSVRPDDLRALSGLARVAWEERDYDAAERHYRRILEVWGDQLTADDLATIQGALGEIALARGDDARSRELLEHALEGGQRPEAMLRDLIAVCERQGDWQSAATYQQRLAERLDDPLERFAALVALAETRRRHLDDEEGARAPLEEAHLIKPDSVAVSVELLEVYLALQRYKDAVDTLHGLIDREEDPARKARFTYTLAVLYRDQLHEPRRASAYLGETLDLDPSRLEAFEALERLLVKHKDFEGQAAAYRDMLERVGGKGDYALEYRLFRNLATIYASALGKPTEGVEALRQALVRRPDALDAREQLARLLEDADPGGTAALDEFRRILRRDARNVDAWKALGRIFARRRDRDGVWCVCGVVRVIGTLDPKEQAFYDKHDKPALALRRALSGIEDWERYLLAEDQDLLLGRIFELLSRTLADGLAARTLADLGLSPRDRVSLSQRSRFTSFLGTVSKILRVPIPGVYRSGEARCIRKEPLFPPVMVVGPEVLTGRKGKELRFLIGKALAYFLPPHLLAGMYPAGHLRTLLVAAMRTVLPDVSQGGEPGVRGIQKRLEQSLRKADAEALQQMAQELTERRAGLNLNEWLSQVERTANRAGHLLCNDLEVAFRMIREERAHGLAWSKLTIDEAIDDLMRYSVSDRYLTLRRELGAAIEASKP